MKPSQLEITEVLTGSPVKSGSRKPKKEKNADEDYHKKLVNNGYDTFHRKFSDGHVVSFAYSLNPIGKERYMVIAFFNICSKKERQFIKSISYKNLFDITIKNSMEDTNRCFTFTIDKFNKKKDMRYIRDAIHMMFKGLAIVGKSSIPRQLTYHLRWYSKFDLC